MNLEQLEQTRNLANNLNAPVSIHLSESQFESEFSTQNYGMTSIEALESINFFEGTTIAAHVVWPYNMCCYGGCLLYTSPSPRDATLSRMPSSA